MTKYKRPERVVPDREDCGPYIACMADILLGLLAIIAGGAMLFAGQFVLRLVIPIWGFFAGFAFGAGLVADLADERFLGTVLGWVLGLVFALVFAVLAYLYYYVAIILAMAAFGFAIGSGLVVALGIDWNWVAVLVGTGRRRDPWPRVDLRQHAGDRARRLQLDRGRRRCGRWPDAAGGLAELRRLHEGRLHRHRRQRLGLVTAPAGAGVRRDLQSGPAEGRAAPHHPARPGTPRPPDQGWR